MSQIPDHAVCVWKGLRMSMREWEQEQFDGSYATFQRAKRFDSIQGIIVDGDDIVLPYELQPAMENRCYGLWGGVLEEGEEPMAALERELLEETGFLGHVEPWMIIEKGGAVEWTDYYFIIRDVKKIQQPQREPGEKIQEKRMSFAEFLDVVVEKSFRNSSFATYVMREFLLPGKTSELQDMILGVK